MRTADVQKDIAEKILFDNIRHLKTSINNLEKGFKKDKGEETILLTHLSNDALTLALCLQEYTLLRMMCLVDNPDEAYGR